MEKKDIKEESNTKYSGKKRIIYSRSDVNITKTKLISDMSNIPKEYYEDIYDLINKFKNGTLGTKKIKTILSGNKSDGHIELKGDGVRVILKYVNNNIYNVLGAFIKKANNDMNTYRIIISRKTPDISTEKKLATQLELSKQTEEELEKIVKEKGRKNGR